MSFRYAWLLATLCVALIAPSIAVAQLITFDNLHTTETPIPNGYGGLNWTNFRVLNVFTYNLASGYKNAAVSPPNVAYNAFGDPASFSATHPFTLQSLYLTAAWNDGMNIQIDGLSGGVVTHTADVTVNTSGPAIFTLDWQSVDDVTLVASGGTHHAGYSGVGTAFAMDNLQVTSVPEAGTLWICGLLSAAAMAYHPFMQARVRAALEPSSGG